MACQIRIDYPRRLRSGGRDQYSRVIRSARLRQALAAGIVLSFTGIGLICPNLRAEDSRDRLHRIARQSIVSESSELGRLLKKKLYVTRDEVARYLFLTNGNDGDHSVALYRAIGKADSLPGSYWVTTTEASTALHLCIPYEGQKEAPVDPKSVAVKRYDAALPASTALAVHELWLAMLERSRPESHLQISPTGIFSAANANGIRLRGATSWLGNNSMSWEMVTLGETLIRYTKIPAADRPKSAGVIEKYSKRLLERVRQVPIRG